MNKKHFNDSLELIKKDLVNFEVNDAFNSIGSNIFLEFGQERVIVLPNGKKDIQKEWTLWISNASWRISQHDKYIVGSGDAPENIQAGLQNLLGKHFQSFNVLSQFFDMEFNFEEGYQLTTFFNWSEENQWTFLLPDRTDISIDCSNNEMIKNMTNISTTIKIKEIYKLIDLSITNLLVKKITYDENALPTIHLENGISISLEICTWRLEKDSAYCKGYLDDANGISQLVGKKIKQVDISNSMMDARFQFEDQYVLKTFTCCRAVNQWKVYSLQAPIFDAAIQLASPLYQSHSNRRLPE